MTDATKVVLLEDLVDKCTSGDNIHIWYLNLMNYSNLNINSNFTIQIILQWLFNQKMG